MVTNVQFAVLVMVTQQTDLIALQLQKPMINSCKGHFSHINFLQQIRIFV